LPASVSFQTYRFPFISYLSIFPPRSEKHQCSDEASLIGKNAGAPEKQSLNAIHKVIFSVFSKQIIPKKVSLVYRIVRVLPTTPYYDISLYRSMPVVVPFEIKTTAAKRHIIRRPHQYIPFFDFIIKKPACEAGFFSGFSISIKSVQTCFL
jgi:hypothetical protein